LKEKGKINANAKVNGKVASGSESGSSSRTSTSRGGKGKERERERVIPFMTPAEEEVQWGGGKTRIGGQSFLPMYACDAMKVKKRFEHMRVGFLSFHLVLRFFVLPFSCCFFLSFVWCWRRS
jgi:hypothetical protein